jgi:hypothetical protein
MGSTIAIVIRVWFAVVLAVCLMVFTGARVQCRPDCCHGDPSTSGSLPTPTTGFWKSLTGEFSYNSSATQCRPAADLARAVDPITVIARLHYHSFLPDSIAPVDWDDADEHVRHHGWNSGANGGQYFRQDNGCVPQGLSLARNEIGSERFHVRGYQHFGVQDPYHYGATVSAMTPHYDEAVTDLSPPWTSCAAFDHYVEADYDPDPLHEWSGFDRGREELVSNWLDDGGSHHRMVESQFWGRPVPRIQCNEDETTTDGYVYHIGLCEESYPC